MVKNYNQRLAETRARSPSDNLALYQQRSIQGQECGVLESVILEQIRDSCAQNESDSCAGSR